MTWYLVSVEKAGEPGFLIDVRTEAEDEVQALRDVAALFDEGE